MPENVNIQETIPKFCHCCRLFGDCTAFTEFSLLFSTYLKNIYFIQIIIAFISSISWGRNLFEAVKVYVKNCLVNMDLYLVQVF